MSIGIISSTHAEIRHSSNVVLTFHATSPRIIPFVLQYKVFTQCFERFDFCVVFTDDALHSFVSSDCISSYLGRMSQCFFGRLLVSQTDMCMVSHQ